MPKRLFENLLVTAMDDNHFIMSTISLTTASGHGNHLVDSFKEGGLVQKQLDSFDKLLEKRIGNCSQVG